MGLAGAGYGPEDPISQFAAYEAAVQQRESLGGAPNGEPIPRNRLSQGTPQDRLNAEVEAGYVMGLFDEDGLLHQPSTPHGGDDEDPGFRQFTRISEAAESAGVDLPFVDRDGRPAILRVRPGEQLTSDVLATEQEQTEAEVVASEEAGNTRAPTAAPSRDVDTGQREGSLNTSEEAGIRASSLTDLARRSAPSSRVEYLDVAPVEGGSAGAAQAVSQGGAAQVAGALGLGDARAEIQAAGVPGLGTQQVEAGLETVRTMSRAAFMILDAPTQELQGQFRNLVGAMRGRDVNFAETQSDLGITLGRALTGGEALDTGQGYFVDPRSELAQERLRRERARGTIGGHAITLGRTLAYGVGADPDSTAFNLLSGVVDAGVQLYGDPSVWALKGVGKVGMGRRFLADDAIEAVGGVRGRVRSIMTTSADQFLNGRRGRGIVEHLAGEGNAGRVWNTLGRKVDPALAARIADTMDPDDVADLLRGELGLTFRRAGELPRLSDAAYRPGVYVERRQTPALRRLVNQMPGHRIDLDDPQASMQQIEAMLRNARAEPHVIENFLDRMARQGSNLGRYKVTQDAVRDVVRGSLKEHGVADPDVLDDVTRMFHDSHESVRHYLIDTITDGGWGDIAIGGKSSSIPSPHLLVEHTRFAPLPDARRIRRLTASPLVRYMAAKGSIRGKTAASEAGELRFPIALLEGMQNEVWKPFALLRGAWVMRVVGDEQARMAGDAKESIFRHPMSFVSWVVGREGRGGRGRGALDVLDQPLKEADEHVAAMSKIRGTWLGEPGEVPMVDFITYKLGGHRDSDFRRAWASEMATLFSDPVSREVARFDTLDEAVEWFTNGAGQKFRRQLAEAHPELNNPNVARNYIESITELHKSVTGGNGDLLEVIRTGKMKGKSVLEADGIRHRDLSRQLQDYQDFAPEEVVGRRFARNEGHAGRIKAGWDKGTDALFGFLMTKTTNYLSRSPTFRQAYWQRVEELTGHMDEATKRAVIDIARKTNLDPKVPARVGSRKIRRMERSRATGELDLESVDQLAKGFALDETKRLLYDLTERSQFFDAMRLVFPFGEAWKEMFGRWGQILRENPQGLRRIQQVVEGARGEGLGEVVGAPEGEGMFFKNSFGEEVFVYPMSSALTRNTLGVPIPLTGRVQGLNMMGSIVPGLGPVAQVPVSAIIPDKPGWTRTARELLMPFGTPSDEGGPEAWTQQLNFAPAWFQRGWQALAGGGFDPETDRIYVTTTMDVARYLESTGKYDLSTREGMQELLEDAKEKARKLYGIRALAQFVAPSAPSPEFMVETSEGMRQTAALAEEFHRMREESPDTAVEDFLALYGDDVTLVTQAKSRTTVAGLEATTEVEDWVDDNQDLINEFPTTWAFFAPRGGEFDYASYVSQIRKGQRQPLTLDQWLQARNNTLGNMIYAKARRMAGVSPDEERLGWLRDVKARIRENYPGYGDRTGLAERTDPEYLVEEFSRIAEDPRVRDTAAGQGLRIYMRARTMAQEEAENRGLASYRDAQSARDLRDWLRNEVAPRIVRNHPEFDSMWLYLDSEMFDDTQLEAA